MLSMESGSIMLRRSVKDTSCWSNSSRIVSKVGIGHVSSGNFALTRRTESERHTFQARLSSTATARPASQRLSSPLSRLPTKNLLRGIFVGSILKSHLSFNLSVALARRMADRDSFLYTDRNIITRWLVKLLVYDHFCAGTDVQSVQETVDATKRMGFAGVILCPGREIMAEDFDGEASADTESHNRLMRGIEAWKNLHLDTIKMIGRGDFMGVKLTGAGRGIFALLKAKAEPPVSLLDAMRVICGRAESQGSRIWIDAEQQVIQPTIDQWTLALMREHNSRGIALVSNTYQAYLKSCPDTIAHHLRSAQDEGWTLGVKLVRGAYISSETRFLIHDTKADTDVAYDTIAEQLITRRFPGFSRKIDAPQCEVMIAGHNATSINKSTQVYQAAASSGKQISRVRWAQLQGMADEVSCQLLHERDAVRATSVEARVHEPPLYKCLQWGSVSECMQFLLRRATENAGSADRLAESVKMMKEEMWRRLFRRKLKESS